MQANNRDLASVWDMIEAIRNIQTFTNNKFTHFKKLTKALLALIYWSKSPS
jgi:hypothetical protein